MKITQRQPLPDVSLDVASPLLERIFRSRGVTDTAQLDRSLSVLPPPDKMKGVAEAVALLQIALEKQQRVVVVGDFDADGATSSALSVMALSEMGFRNIDYLVPNRFEYGYGLTPEIVQLACGNKPDLIITVDNGISSLAGVEAARSAGIDVLITDHHLPGEQLPEANAIVNPNQPGCEFPSKNLAGVGVVFYLMTALRSQLRRVGWFDRLKLTEPNMADFLDLVALGTVADVVPLDHVNRVLVHQGLLRIQAGRARPGILALIEIAGRDNQRLVSTDLGFAVGPRLNAAGRLDDMSIGIQCLISDNPALAREYAIQLDELNRDRRIIEAGMQREGEAIVEQMCLDDESGMPWGLCLYEENWHQGVVGLLASRIKDRVHRPVIAFALADVAAEEDIQLKGSARSIHGFHIRDALDAIATRHPGLISKFGGHAMAAGLSLALDNFERFSLAFDAEVRRQLTESDLQAELLTDGSLRSRELDRQTAALIRQSGPWGQHFPEPLFAGLFSLVQQRLVGEKHLKIVVSPVDDPDNVIDAIAFNVDLAVWPDATIVQAHLVYKLDINYWRGRESLQLVVESIQPA